MEVLISGDTIKYQVNIMQEGDFCEEERDYGEGLISQPGIFTC